MKSYKDYSWVSTLPTPDDPQFHAECPELGLKVSAPDAILLQEAMEDAYNDLPPPAE